MKILQLIDSVNMGGAQNLVITFCEQAVQHGIETHVVGLSSIQVPLTVDRLEGLGIPVTVFPMRRLLDLGCLLRFCRFLQVERFDLIQAHLTYANVIGILGGFFTGTPVVGTLHLMELNHSFKDAVRNGLECFLLRIGARRVIAIGHQVADFYRPRVGGRAIDVIMNAAPLPTLPAETERPRLRTQITGDASKPLLVSVSRLAAQKGLNDLMNAFALVQRRHPDAVLTIVGDGPEREMLEKRIAALGLQEHVVLAGWRADVGNWLAAADCFVLASLSEGLPIAVLEAMGAGLPIVATQVGDIPRIVLPGMGLLAPAGQPEKLAEAVCTLLDQPEVRAAYGKAAHDYVTRQFNVDDWFARLNHLFGEVTEKRKSEVQASNW